MVNALYAVPAWLLLAIACFVFTAATVSTQMWLHQRFKEAEFIQHNEVGGFIIAVVGTIYAVIVAFIVAIVWQEYEGSASRVGMEAAAGATVWHTAVGLPEPLRTHTRATIVEFAQVMVYDEWPSMRWGRSSARGEALVVGALHDVAQFEPRTFGQANIQEQVLTRLEALHDFRHQRLLDNVSGVSPFEWLTLAFGGVIVVGFCLLFGLQNQRVHRIMTASVTCMIVAAWTLIFELDYPFRGDLAISSQPWQTFLNSIGS